MSRCPFPYSPTVSEFADSAEKPGANWSNPGHFLCCQEAFGPHQSQNQNAAGPGTDPLMRDNWRPEGLKPPRFNLKPDVQTGTRGSNLLLTLSYYHATRGRSYSQFCVGSGGLAVAAIFNNLTVVCCALMFCCYTC